MRTGLFGRSISALGIGLLSGTLAVVAPTGIAYPADQPAQKEKPSKKQKEKQPKKGQSSTGQSSKDRPAMESTTTPDSAAVDRTQVCFGQSPKIEKITPDEAKAGEKVTIIGMDFGTPGCLFSISFGPGNPAKFEYKSESEVVATVPSGKKGLTILTLTTASGEDSKPFFVK